MHLGTCLLPIVLYNNPVIVYSSPALGGKATKVTIGNRLFRSWALPALLFGAVSAHPASASLVFTGVATGTGAGIGTSNVVLTIQNTGTEQGCVGWNGTADVVGGGACPGGLSPAITGGNEKTGNS